MHEYTVIGGGIVGLATAMAVGNKYPQARILLLEKEQNAAPRGEILIASCKSNAR
jgi:(S)-2-hydroxyglutarate dehydrogenase